MFAICGMAFSQSEKIELPDVTTVIEGGVQSVKIPAPDLEISTPLPAKTSSIVPVLPEEEPVEAAPVEKVTETVSDTVVEGKVGGGYPPSFVGQFGVKNNNKSEPYSIEFIHDSVAGLAGKSLNDCYNSVNTGIVLYKAMSFTNGNLSLSGNYASSTNGFQSVVENLSAMNQTFIDFDIDYNLYLSNISYLNISLLSNFYNRYSDITDKTQEIASWQAESRTLSFAPSILYNRTFLNDSLGLEIKGVYNLDMDLKGSLVDSQTIYTSGKTLNRGLINTNVNWKNDVVYLSADAGVVFGSHQNDNKVIVPFDAKAVFTIPFQKFSSVGVSLEGGLKTQRTDIAQLEKKYKYSAFSFIPDETSDWFGSFETNMLIDNKFYVKGSVNYKQTACNNGIWVPVYDGGPENGLYVYEQKDRISLSSDVSVDFKYNMFKITGKFALNLFDLEPLQNRYEYYGKIQYDSDSNWKALIEAKGALDAEDKLPVINTEVSLKLHPEVDDSVEIMLLTKDLIKLFSGAERNYAGCYICDSGSITLLLKFTL